MLVPENAVLLRIYLGETENYDHRPLYEAIVLKAREMHLAGATVLRRPTGFGRASRLHSAKISRLSYDSPKLARSSKRRSRVPMLFSPVRRRSVLPKRNFARTKEHVATEAHTARQAPHRATEKAPPEGGEPTGQLGREKDPL